MNACPCICFSHYTSGYWGDLGFVWSCPLACLGRVGMAERAAVHSIQMIDAISAEIGGTTPTTVTASANEDVEAGEKLVQHSAPAKILKDNVSQFPCQWMCFIFNELVLSVNQEVHCPLQISVSISLQVKEPPQPFKISKPQPQPVGIY